MLNNDIVKYLEKRFPLNLAYEWDKVGLQVGSKNSKVERVLITLDVTIDVINEAIEKGVSLIITHHPFIFNPLKTISFDSYHGKMIMKLIENKISVYSMHTNYDVANGGLNDVLANLLAMQDITPLEMINDVDGLGRIGYVQEQSINDFISYVKSVFNLEVVRFIGNTEKMVRKVAILGGSGSSSASLAKRQGVDLFITGDVKHHDALGFLEMGLNVLDVGHHIESLFTDALAKELKEQFNEVDFISSETKNPFQYK